MSSITKRLLMASAVAAALALPNLASAQWGGYPGNWGGPGYNNWGGPGGWGGPGYNNWGGRGWNDGYGSGYGRGNGYGYRSRHWSWKRTRSFRLQHGYRRGRLDR